MARAQPVPTALPLGGRMVGAQEPLPFGLVCPRHGGPEAVAWQPSGLRGHASATLHQRCRDRSAGGCADWPYLFDHSGASPSAYCSVTSAGRMRAGSTRTSIFPGKVDSRSALSSISRIVMVATPPML